MKPEVIAEEVLAAHDERRRFASLREFYSLDVGGAYAVQAAYVKLLQSRHGPPVGRKVGLTSARVQQMCGLDQPIGGVILEKRVQPSGAVLRAGDYGRLGMEFEIACRLGRDLPPQDEPYDLDIVAAAVAEIAPAYEVIDDRDADYAKLDGVSLVADNSWNAGAVLGRFVPPPADLEGLRGDLEQDGAAIDHGFGRDVMGHPFAPLVWLANHLRRRREGMKAGEIVLTGSICPTRFPKGGERFRWTLAGIGSVEASVL